MQEEMNGQTQIPKKGEEKPDEMQLSVLLLHQENNIYNSLSS